jgi:hypothetical protein
VTSTLQHPTLTTEKVHNFGRIQTHNFSKQAAVGIGVSQTLTGVIFQTLLLKCEFMAGRLEQW